MGKVIPLIRRGQTNRQGGKLVGKVFRRDLLKPLEQIFI